MTLTTVAGSPGQVLPDTCLSVNMLSGEVTGDKTVNRELAVVAGIVDPGVSVTIVIPLS